MAQANPFNINSLIVGNEKLIGDPRIREIVRKGEVVGQNPNPLKFLEVELQPTLIEDSNIHKMLHNISRFEYDLDKSDEATRPVMGPFYVRNEGKVYVGQFDGDRMSGRGILIYTNQCYYEGYFKDDNTHKNGRLIYHDGDMYLGQLKDSTMEGQGVYYKKDGSKYTGTFKNDAPEGKGREEWEDGAEFQGYYKVGSKNGYGEFRFNNRDVYKGQFKEDVFEGEGTLIRSSGVKFIGQWKNGDLESPASIISPNGSVYKGEIKKMVSNGKGVLKDGGRIYDGSFANGKPVGNILVKNGEGDKGRMAIFKDGKFSRWLDEGASRSNSPTRSPKKSPQESKPSKKWCFCF